MLATTWTEERHPHLVAVVEQQVLVGSKLEQPLEQEELAPKDQLEVS